MPECINRRVIIIDKNIADKIITSIFTRIWSAQLAENIVEEAINNFNNGIVELPRYCPWQDYVIAHNSKNGNRIKFVFWYDTRGEQYMAQGVPVSTKTRETLASFPENIRGKTAEEIDKICGTNSATFVHPTGFLGGWKNKEDLVKVLHSILK